MALSPLLSFCNKDNCKILRFEDIRGTYQSPDNTGGWGTPNTELADVTEATISLTLPNETTEVDLDVTETVVAATIVDGEFSLGEFTMEDFGGEEDAQFPDGIYEGSYTIWEVDESYEYTFKTLNLCKVTCCLEKMKTKFQKWDCNSCDFESNMMNYYKAKTILLSIKNAFSCGDDTKANSHLASLQKICANMQCEC